ncbi:MAG: type II toxin-antitoxin system HicB family antitoxin [Cyanobacteria bacterium J06643_13]
MKYKGYTAHIEIDETAGILFGKVLDIKDVITFKGTTVAELETEFHNSVNDYLEWCAELGEEPDKPFSGKLPFRTTPENHRQIYLAAKKANKSINAWMDEVLSAEVKQCLTETSS